VWEGSFEVTHWKAQGPQSKASLGVPANEGALEELATKERNN